MKFLSIIGARPQFIKASAISRVLRKNKEIEEVVVHTGQHYDFNMSEIFFDEFKMKIDYNLGVGSGNHGEQTGKMLIELEKVLMKEKPNIVLVYGDTNSTLAGSLASAKLHLSIAHVESGLRSFNKKMPEEINRVLTDHISDILFAPTNTAVKNLKNEGIKKGIYKVGDVMFDVLLHNKKIAEKSEILNKLNLKDKKYFVATIHRQSNTDIKENLENIVKAFIETNEKIIFPCHPRTLKFLKQFNLYEKINNKNVELISPLSYLDFLKLMSKANKILTDSGGIQKESYLLKVPCITLREETEWVETVEDGWNILVGTDKEKIIRAVKNFIPKKKQRNLFGDGSSAEKIVKILEEYCKGGKK